MKRTRTRILVAVAVLALVALLVAIGSRRDTAGQERADPVAHAPAGPTDARTP